MAQSMKKKTGGVLGPPSALQGQQSKWQHPRDHILSAAITHRSHLGYLFVPIVQLRLVQLRARYSQSTFQGSSNIFFRERDFHSCLRVSVHQPRPVDPTLFSACSCKPAVVCSAPFWPSCRPQLFTFATTLRRPLSSYAPPLRTRYSHSTSLWSIRIFLSRFVVLPTLPVTLCAAWGLGRPLFVCASGTLLPPHTTTHTTTFAPLRWSSCKSLDLEALSSCLSVFPGRPRGRSVHCP